MATIPDELSVHLRGGLPEDLLSLLRRHPRESWQRHPFVGGLAAFWLQRHAMFRALSAELGAAIAELADRRIDPNGFSRPFVQRANLLLGHLEMHHHVEDHRYFPVFARAVPSLRRGFDILDHDHHALHDGIASFADAARELVAVCSNRAPLGAEAPDRAAERMTTAMRAFERILLRHLDDEEDLVIPLVLDRAGDDPTFR